MAEKPPRVFPTSPTPVDLPEEFYATLGRIVVEYSLLEQLATTLVLKLMNEKRPIQLILFDDLRNFDHILQLGIRIAPHAAPADSATEVVRALKETDRIRQRRNGILHSFWAPSKHHDGRVLQARKQKSRGFVLEQSDDDMETLDRFVDEITQASTAILHLRKGIR